MNKPKSVYEKKVYIKTGKPVGAPKKVPKPPAANPFVNLPTEKHDVIIADPPWNYRNGPNLMLDFPMLTEEELVFLNPRPMLNKRGVLFLWATSSTIAQAVRLISAWKLNYRGIAFVWAKTRNDGQLMGAKGPRPSINKPTCEFVLAASKAKYGRPLPLACTTVPQLILAPPRESCRKPTEVMAAIEQLYPSQSKLELFAREWRFGWDAWGNETNKYVSRTESIPSVSSDAARVCSML